MYRALNEVVPQEAQEHLEEYQVVDVRSAKEFTGELGHIEGALLLPLDSLEKCFESLDRERPVLAVCRSGRRSLEACRQLAEKGFSTTNLQGGMIAWNDAELPVSRGD